MKNRKQKELCAFGGTILRINLSNGEIRREPTSKYAREWLGASGIAVKLLYDGLHSWVTPYDPANLLIFGPGTLVGTPAPGANKMNASTLGPLTGGWASGYTDSYLGGELKYAGYDLLVVEGRAQLPVYLWIHDDTVEIRDAGNLWGKTTWDTLDTLRKENQDPDLHTISIGPAGEHLTRMACLIQDKGRAIGRCGIGAVMGSKNLKCIVAKGSGSVRVAEPVRFMKAAAKYRAQLVAHPVSEKLRRYGTLSILQAKQDVGGICYKNFQDVTIPEEMVKLIEPTKTIEKYQVRRQSSPGCAIGGCGRHLHITEGPYAGLKTEACQWEAMCTLQTRLAMREPTFVFKANAYCNQMGLDVESAGAIGWAMECWQRGILDEKDTDGLKLEWGNEAVALELIRKISYREGFGNILAEGGARAADIVGRGSEAYAVHIKKQDLYEPCRGALGWCLGTTTSTRGGGHTTGAPWFETVGDLDMEKAREIYGVDTANKPTEYDGKAEMVTIQESVHRVTNCLGICLINTIAWNLGFLGLPEMAELYSAATGWETSIEDLITMSRRQINMEKALNLRFTEFARKDDLPHSRDLDEPMPSGSMAGWKIDKEKYNQMLDRYYDLHGWDRETSYPTRKTLANLGLSSVADDLEKIGKLGRQLHSS